MFSNLLGHVPTLLAEAQAAPEEHESAREAVRERSFASANVRRGPFSLFSLGILDAGVNPIGHLPPIRIQHHVMSHAGENLRLRLISTCGASHVVAALGQMIHEVVSTPRTMPGTVD